VSLCINSLLSNSANECVLIITIISQKLCTSTSSCLL